MKGIYSFLSKIKVRGRYPLRKLSKNRFIIWGFLLMFTCSGLAYGQQTATVPEAMPESGKPVGLTAPGGTGVAATPFPVTELNPYNLIIPEKFGKVEEVFQGLPGSPVIVHIQDAHANYEAQVNIKNILGHLSKNYNMNLIQLEGASSQLNPAIFETAYLKEANQKLADYLMREGRLSGAEAFAVESEKPVELHGIENRMLYMENLRTFRSVYSHQAEITNYFNSLRMLAKDVRLKLLNGELLDLTRNMEAYASEKIDLIDYLVYLDGLAEQHKLASLKKLTEITRFPNLVRILRLHELEKQLNERQVKKEAEAIREAFRKKTSDSEVADLLASLELKKKGMKPRAYFKKVTALAEQHGIDLLGYPQMRAMSEFLILQDEIEHRGLFAEVHRLEQMVQKQLFKTKEERHLMQLLRNIELLDQYFKLEVNREKLAYIIRHYDTMKASYLKDELDALAKKLGIMPSDYQGDVMKLDQIMDDVEYFYRVVLERDRLFVENVMAKTKGTGTDRTVLITGGFHTDGLTALLKKQNISYLVVIPKVDVKQGTEKYVKIMTEGDSEVGSVFAGTFAVQNPRYGNPQEVSPGSLNFYILEAALGAGMTFQIEGERGELSPEVVTEQRAVLERFNTFLPYMKAALKEELPAYDANTGTATFNMVFRLNDNGKNYEVEYQAKVSADNYELTPVKVTELKGQKAAALNLVNPDTLPGNELPQGRVLSADTPLLQIIGETRVVTPNAETATADVRNAFVFPGVVVLNDAFPEEVLPILSELQNNPAAMNRVAGAVRTGEAITRKMLEGIQAEAQIANRPIQARDVEQGVDDLQRQEAVIKFLALLSQPSVTSMVLPLLDTVSSEVNKKQLRSLLEVIQHNAGASAVVVGPDAKNFTTREVNENIQDPKMRQAILSRIRFVETEAKDVAAQLADDRVAVNIQTQAFQAYQKIDRQLKIPGITPRTLVQDGYVKVLLPGDEQGAEVGEQLRQNDYLANAVQLHSALERDGIRNNDAQASAFADIQVKVLSILPKKFKADEIREFTELLNRIGLGGIVVPGVNGWEIGKGVEALVSQLFTDFLAAREIAIRA